MEFIKRNILLVLVLVICLIASALLVYMSYQEQSKVAASLSDVHTNTEELEKLSKKQVSPCKENEDRYLADAKIFKEKAFELQRIFGQPFRTPLQEMAKGLEITELELLEKFRNYWESEYSEDNKSHYHLYNGFIKSLAVKEAGDSKEVKETKTVDGKIINAINMFKKTLLMQPQNLEDVDDNNLYKFILSSFGVPPEMSPTSCRTYINTMQGKLEKRLTEPNPQELKMGFSRVKLGKGVEKFTLESFDKSLPHPDQIPLVVKHIRAIEDIFYRLQLSGISSVSSVSKENSIQGDFQNHYQTFIYKLTLTGSLESIRKFINALQIAYLQNRVYVIRNVTLKLVDDEVKNISSATAVDKPSTKPVAPGPAVFAPGGPPQPPVGIYDPRMMGKQPPKAKSIKKSKSKTIVDVSKLPPEQRPGYGKAIVGNSKNVLAVIEIDYIIYTGDNF